MAHGDNVEIDTGLVEGCIRDGRAEDLAIARDVSEPRPSANTGGVTPSAGSRTSRCRSHRRPRAGRSRAPADRGSVPLPRRVLRRCRCAGRARSLTDGATPRSDSPNASTSVSNESPSRGNNSPVTRSRARSILGLPARSAMPMLREASISIGTTGRAVRAVHRAHRTHEEQHEQQQRRRSEPDEESDDGRVRSGARPICEPSDDDNAEQDQEQGPRRASGCAKVTLLRSLLCRRDRLEVPGDGLLVSVGNPLAAAAAQPIGCPVANPPSSTRELRY